MAHSNSKNDQRIIFLSHADTDLSMLMSAVRELPEGFPQVSGYCLQIAIWKSWQRF